MRPGVVPGQRGRCQPGLRRHELDPRRDRLVEPGVAIELLLVGAGHAHLEILRRLIVARPAGLAATIVSLEDRHFYSGMIPGYLADQYSFDDLTTDVPAIARRAGVQCVIGRAVGLDPDKRRVALEDGRSLTYDVVSFNIGSLLAGAGTEAARSAERIKPLHRAPLLKERLAEIAASDAANPARIVVVGAGASGVEVAFAAAATMKRARRPAEISIVDSRDRLLSGYSERFRSRTRRALDRAGILLLLDRPVAGVEPGQVQFEGDESMPSDLTVWLTGPAADPFLAASGLPTDPRGFLLIHDTLQSVGDPRVFAVGDCGTLANYPATAKAGVYAVREAPILWNNLLALIGGEPLASYQPQAGFLSILNTCDGRALLAYKGFVSWSRWAWWLKDRIDRRFVRQYQEVAD